jgi:tetratricopeptide (TPR) repeat protein
MKSYLALALSLCILSASAQTKTKSAEAPKESKSASSNFELDIYKRAISYGDYDAAKNALFRLMTANPDSIKYLDSLVTLYFSIGAMPQCILSGKEYLKKDTSNQSVMEMVAVSYSQLKNYKEAVDMYEKLYMKSGNLHYAYQLAVHQYLLKRIGECNQMLDIIIADPKAEQEKVGISGDDNKSQQVPLKAAALNLRGVIMQELSMTDKAKENFEAALKIMPEFALAKGNLESMNKKAEAKKEAPAEKKPEEKKK